MSGETGQWFSCPQCGQRFAWQQGYAGRKVSCGCGQVFEAQPEPTEVLQVAPAGAARPVRLGYRSAAVGQGSMPPRQKLREILGSRPFWIGVALVVFGGGVRGAYRLFLSASEEMTLSTGIGLGIMGWAMLVTLGLIGVSLAASFMDYQAGGLPSTLAKLAGITLVAMVAFPLVAGMDRGDGITGKLMALNVVTVLYWLMFAGFFKLNFMETAVTVGLVMLLQSAAACVLLQTPRGG